MTKKHFSIILAAVLLLTPSLTRAGGFLIKGGLAFQNLSSTIDAAKAASFKSNTGWVAGIGYQTPTWGGFSLQPEVQYRSKSYDVMVANEKLATASSSFVEVPVNVQWGVDFLILRTFVFASPYVGFNIGNKVSVGNLSDTFANKKVTGGVGLGLGFEIAKLQITAKYNWDFGGVANWNDYWSQMGDTFKNLKLKEGSVHIGLAFIF